MRIRDIEVINLRFEYPPDRRFRYVGGTCTGRLTSLVRVHTDEGLVGVGSVYSHPDLVRTVIEGHLRSHLLGKDPLAIEEIYLLCLKVTGWYGRTGAAVSAIGGIDIALWDLKGKAEGKRVCDIISGTAKERVPAYASGLLWKRDVGELADEALSHLADGFRGMKMRLGKGGAYDFIAVEEVRRAVGPNVRLMVDGNGAFSEAHAFRIVSVLQAANVFWLEEPFPSDDYGLYSSFGDCLTVPLAAGENETSPVAFGKLIDSGAVSIAQPDCCRCGGLTEALRIAAYAAEHHVDIAPHTWSDAVALTANMHLVATQENALTVEVDRTGNPFVDDLLAGGPRIEDGFAVLPDGPGLGVELNEDVVARHTVPRGERTPPGNYSDMVFL